MAKRTDSPVRKVSGVSAALAAYTEDDHSMDEMAELVILPRIKLIQSMSDSALKKKFGEGSAVVLPGDAVVVDAQGDGVGAFEFTPLLFYQEFCKWRDLKDKQRPSVVERSFDGASATAANCKDWDRRFEVYEGDEKKKPDQQRNFRFVHHLRFIGLISGDHELSGTTAIISFERGEFQNGRSFISAIRMRKITVPEEFEGEMIDVRKPCPLWAQVWQFSVSERPGEQGSWFGFDFEAADKPMIEESDIDRMREAHEEYAELHKKNRLRVEEDVDSEDDAEPNAEL